MKNYNDFCDQNAERLFKIINEHGSLLKWKKEWKNDCSTMIPESANGFYKGGNIFNLFYSQIEKGFKSNKWLTFNQVNKLNGSVKKGAKSEIVYYWSFYKKKTKNKATVQEEIKEIPFFKTYRVFNLEQTSLFNDDKISAVHPKVCNLLSDCGVAINHFGTKAFYSPNSDIITLPQQTSFDSFESYHATLLHELTHATGHESRLNRDSLKNYSDIVARSEEELVAEIGAFFLCSFFNINSDIENHASYVNSWKQHLKPVDIMKATNNAAKAFHFLLDNAEQIHQDMAA